MTYRPKFTGKDENHFIPRDFFRYRCGGFESYKFGKYYSYTANFRGVPFMLIDTSAFGGTMPDWILERLDNGQVRWLEVKTPDAYLTKNQGLKPAEEWLQDRSINFHFVVTDGDMEYIMIAMVEA